MYADIEKALQCRLAELLGNVAEIDSERRSLLPAGLEEQVTELENLNAHAGIEKSKLQETRQICDALKRIAEGSYGICAQCGEPIDPKRLKALPTAAKCILCAA